MKYKKVLIKFSGESFGKRKQKIDYLKVQPIVQEIKLLRKAKVLVAVVCGGGNVSRWRDVKKGNRVAVDYRGMKGTLANAIFLEKLLKKARVPVQLYTSFAIKSKYPHFEYSKTQKDLKQGKVLIFAGGTGYPFFTTDTVAVLYSLIIGADLFIKATKVDGVFSADPFKHPTAKRFTRISTKEYLKKKLKVVDQFAIYLAQENKLLIKVIKWQAGAVIDSGSGKTKGTTIYPLK
ncbi:uridine monophosphate kinase [Patescibacteria group bacterium]|nr:uridine monophosphate kinase [Patescibacteria group bacterium]